MSFQLPAFNQGTKPKNGTVHGSSEVCHKISGIVNIGLVTVTPVANINLWQVDSKPSLIGQICLIYFSNPISYYRRPYKQGKHCFRHD